MSYMFHFAARSRAEAKQRLSTELDRVAEQQPVHRNDRDQAQAAAEAMLSVVPEPGENNQLAISVSGSISWRSGDDEDISGASITVSIGTEALVQQQPVR